MIDKCSSKLQQEGFWSSWCIKWEGTKLFCAINYIFLFRFYQVEMRVSLGIFQLGISLAERTSQWPLQPTVICSRVAQRQSSCRAVFLFGVKRIFFQFLVISCDFLCDQESTNWKSNLWSLKIHLAYFVFLVQTFLSYHVCCFVLKARGKNAFGSLDAVLLWNLQRSLQNFFLSATKMSQLFFFKERRLILETDVLVAQGTFSQTMSNDTWFVLWQIFR